MRLRNIAQLTACHTAQLTQRVRAVTERHSILYLAEPAVCVCVRARARTSISVREADNYLNTY
jgi:hypothetical protein